MAHVRSTNTAPEVLVRRVIHKMGYRYRLHRHELPGHRDIVFPSRRKIVFVHGCFWHQHSCHRGSRKPASNQNYWLPKLKRNRERDALNLGRLKALGWSSLVIWECDDRAELARAARLLRPSGKIIVLAPAHQWLFTPFDTSIGHHRRYNRPSLQDIAPPGCRLIRLSYLDSVGMLASLTNRIFLRQPMPKESQILLWDRVLVRLSRIVDQVSFHRVGKSILVVWQLVDSGQGTRVG